MMIRQPRFLACGLILAVGGMLSCAGKPGPAPTPPANTTAVAPGAPSAMNELSSIQVADQGGTTNIVVTGSKPMSPNIFKLTDPHRIIVDLTDTKLGSVQGPIDVKNGGINEITVSQFDDAASSLSRVVISLNEPLDYQVESDGTKLMIKINKGLAAPSASDTGLPESPAVSAPDLATAPSITESPTPSPETAPAEAAPPVADNGASPASGADAGAAAATGAAVGALAPEADATELTDVQYSAGESGTTIRLIGNGPIKNVEDHVLASPRRLVVDLMGLKNGYPGNKNIALATPQVKALRLGKNTGKVRVVMDMATDDKPAYTIDHDGNALVLTVAAAPAAAPEAPVAAAEAPAGSPEVTPPAVTPPTAAPEAVPAAPEATPEVAAAPVVKSSHPVVVNALGFRQLKAENKSRVVVGLNEATSDYQTLEPSPGKIVLEISNAKLDKKLAKRTINTSEFQTAVTKITPQADRGRKVAMIEIDLDEKMPFAVTQEGTRLYVDVDVPATVARKQTETPVASSAPLPPPPAEEAATTATPAPEASPTESFMATEEKSLSGDEAKPAGPKPGDKDYRYVREGFMSDSSASGEPLSEMGAILAGQYKGRKFTGRKISLDFKDAEVRSIFRLIADISKLNMIVSDEVTGKVTVRLENVPWDQAFAIILQTRGLWFEKYGNIVRIAPAEKLRAERELAAAAEKASQAAKPLDVLFKPVSYATASDMTKQVQSVLSDRGSVDIDSRTNTLIIKDIRENLEKAKKMVEILDTQTPQVSIEARIVEANTNYTRSFGVIWGGQANFTPQTGNPTGVFFPNSIGLQGLGAGQGTTSFSGLPVALNYPSPLGTNAGVGIKLGSINGVLDLDLALGLLETKGYAKIISSPKITVLDNKSATIQAGSKIPFLTQTANAGSNVRFESATTSIAVTPHVTNDGAVSLKISTTRNEPNFAQLVQGNPLVDQRTADTEVLVKSGNTTVLGGVYSIRTGGTEDSLPYISKIPIIGWLFKNYAKELRRSELLIFVTPRIVGDEREAVRDIRG